MLKKVKDEILSKSSFSILNQIVENTIFKSIKEADRTLGKNLGIYLFRTNSNFTTILFVLFLSLLTLQCSKSGTDPVVTPTPPADTSCPNGQGKANACTSCNAGYSVSNGTCLVQNNLVLSVSSLNMYASLGDTASFTINTDQNWTITNNLTWLSVNPMNGGPGATNKITLTTTNINTLEGVSEALSINATGNASLNKTLSLTRSRFAFCGGTYGVVGPSVVIYKWITTGGAGTEIYSNANVQLPNSRFLATFIKGCQGGAVGSVQQDLTTVRSVSLYYREVASGNLNSVSNLVSLGQGPAVGLSATRTIALFAGFNESSFIMELRDESNAIVAQIAPFIQLYTSANPTFNEWTINPQTKFATVDLNKGYANVSGIGGTSKGTPPDLNPNNLRTLDFSSSVSETAFPRVGREVMNALLDAANKTYRIPLN